MIVYVNNLLKRNLGNKSKLPILYSVLESRYNGMNSVLIPHSYSNKYDNEDMRVVINLLYRKCKKNNV